MEILNNPLFWVCLFVIQVYLLSILSSKLFNLLYLYLFKIFKKESTVVFAISMMFLPGTFVHELSHAISATLLGSRVTKFSIWPKVENGGIKMGYAQFVVVDIFRNTLIGISPLIFGIIILYFLITNFFMVSINMKILFFYLIFQVSNSMFLSESDIKEFKSLVLITLILVTGTYFFNLYFLKLDILGKINFNFLSSLDINFFFYLNIFFFTTLVINFIFLIIFFMLNKIHRY